ncbi:HAMP domain-containing protein [Geomonas sp. Red69]|uniref:histidine kinase n=1 Tax=Geomonas diazotrophica TaxID=2843197 RepID=A0ABX8JI90_9BACT|nr:MULTISPECIES: HAMP domain-containing sensor histidine kinase [Geomonas]MBU5635654.1 HAMP domain-containing protein [Geomonas diazotrophica]QWV98104.1 HAMP domain-containing protein [Geomonas nitrogeniifigens]QXE87235.1 HAMP domain-containing protein [Geomonas nitrogeniifigens]
MRLNLISKLALASGLVLLCTMALFAYLNLRSLKGLLLQEAISEADRITETIIRTTHNQMLRDDRPLFYKTIEEIGNQQGVERIRLINKTGRIIFSTDDSETGTVLGKHSEICAVCHGGPELLLTASSKNRSRRFYGSSGAEFLGITNAIYNEESCYTASCHFHPEKFKVLGVLDVVVPLDRMHSLLDAYRGRMLFLTLLLITLTSLSLTFFTQKLVNRPVRELLEHTQMLSRGELDGLVHSFANDEMGELADSFNTMTLNLKKARQELEGWGRDLEQMVQQRTQEITRMQAQLIRSEKLASLGELVAGIAHEINNPLTGILVFASLIQSNPRLDPVLKNDIETVLRETKRCAGIVKGLLEFARCAPPQKTPCSLNEISDAALELVRHQILFQDVTIARNYSGRIPALLLDPNQIEQVLVNMLVNAGHALRGEGMVMVVTGVDPVQELAFIRISDNGCGIPEANLGRIFDPFFTTKSNKGTGLGLSVSYGIIQEHGGRIEVQSEEGAGTTFTILLPVPQADAPLPPLPDPKGAGLPAGPETA